MQYLTLEALVDRPAILHVYDDGGRARAGFLGQTGDCVVRAIAIATGGPYREIYDSMNGFAKESEKRRRTDRHSSSRQGVYKDTTKRFIEEVVGWRWTPTMGIGTGCKVHLKASELPSGRIIVNLSRHLAAVVNGVLHDLYDCSRDGTRCVYGYWSQERP